MQLSLRMNVDHTFALAVETPTRQTILCECGSGSRMHTVFAANNQGFYHPTRRQKGLIQPYRDSGLGRQAANVALVLKNRTHCIGGFDRVFEDFFAIAVGHLR